MFFFWAEITQARCQQSRAQQVCAFFLQIFEHLGRENKSVAEIERPSPGWQWTKDRVALTEKMALPLLCTSSPPGGDPRTSSMHAGCHSRRMTSFSSTMPFPLLTLNCHTPPLLHLLHIFPACRASLFSGYTHTHTFRTYVHTRTWTHMHDSSFCDLQSVGSCKASHHLTCSCTLFLMGQKSRWM